LGSTAAIDLRTLTYNEQDASFSEIAVLRSQHIDAWSENRTDLFVTQLVAIERIRSIHRQHSHDLHEIYPHTFTISLLPPTHHSLTETQNPELTVLQDIPYNPKLVKVTPSSLTTKRFFELDHDRLNVVLVQ
jgi:hypothetical protein